MNAITKPQLHDPLFDDVRHKLRLSKYRVERCFDALPLEEKQVLILMCGFQLGFGTSGDQLPNTSGLKLAHYTRDGQLKIAQAVRLIRTIANRFPVSIRASEFMLNDHHYLPNNP